MGKESVDDAALVFTYLTENPELISDERGKKLLRQAIKTLKTDPEFYDVVVNGLPKKTIINDKNGNPIDFGDLSDKIYFD